MKPDENKIVKCKPQPDYHLWIQFEDGLEGIVDLNDLVDKSAFKKAWKISKMFNKVRIDPITETITWGKDENTVDVNPEELRKEILRKKHK